MVKYYDLILELPLILIIVLKVFGLIKTKTAIIYWISFFVASVTYAVSGDGFAAVLTLLFSFAVISVLLCLCVKLKVKMSANKACGYVALYTKDETAVFFDGRKKIEKSLISNEGIIPGKIYIIKKNN